MASTIGTNTGPSALPAAADGATCTCTEPLANKKSTGDQHLTYDVRDLKFAVRRIKVQEIPANKFLNREKRTVVMAVTDVAAVCM